MEFTKEVLEQIRGDVGQALHGVARKYGVTIRDGGGSFSPLEATLKWKFSTVGENGETSEQRDYKNYARSFGLQLEWLGKTVTLRGKTAIIVGLLPKRIKYPVLVQYVGTGKRVLFTVDTVVSQLGSPSEAKAITTSILVISGDKTPEQTIEINRNQFTAKEWDTITSHGLIRGGKLFGRECLDCHEHKVVLVSHRRAGPEVVHLGYRCVGCGAEDSDVMD